MFGFKDKDCAIPQKDKECLNSSKETVDKTFWYYLPKMSDKLKDSYVISKVCNYIEDNGGTIERMFTKETITNEIKYTAKERIVTKLIASFLFLFEDDKEILSKLTS